MNGDAWRLRDILIKDRRYIVLGGTEDDASTPNRPTVKLGDDIDAFANSCMQREIFGPILLVYYSDLDQALAIMARHPDPLSTYVFDDEEFGMHRRWRAGSLVHNNTAVIGGSELPLEEWARRLG